MVWKGRLQKDKGCKGFFVAGNSLGLRASIFTFTATWFSAASMEGLTGTLYGFGYSGMLYSVVGWFLRATLLVLMAAKLKAHDILTVPEYFRIFAQAANGIVLPVVAIGLGLRSILKVLGFM